MMFFFADKGKQKYGNRIKKYKILIFKCKKKYFFLVFLKK